MPPSLQVGKAGRKPSTEQKRALITEARAIGEEVREWFEDLIKSPDNVSSWKDVSIAAGDNVYSDGRLKLRSFTSKGW